MTKRSARPATALAFAAAILLLFGSVWVGVRIERPRVTTQWPADVQDNVQTRRELQQALGDARAQAPPPSLEWRTAREALNVAQPQSLIALAAAVMLLALSRARAQRARLLGAAGIVVALTVSALAVTLSQPIRLGDFGTYVSSRASFEAYVAGPSVRFEAHLSTRLLRMIDASLGADARSPALAFQDLSMYATFWFGLMLGVAGWSLGWSPSALRYLALAIAAPATVAFFGYKELGYLSLNPAVFPLVVTGLRSCSARFNTASALAGLGAALHAFGLLSLVGTAIASFLARVRLRARAALVLHAFAFGTSAYLVWVFVYVAVMGLRVIPGHSEHIPWRPLWSSALVEHRINPGLLTPEGLIENLVASAIVGAPLVLTALATARRHGRATLIVLGYTLPSLLFLWTFWPIQGLAVEADLLFGAFPAIYALAWLASRSSVAAWWSLIVLASGHAILWRVLLGDFFVNSRVY